MLKGILTYMVDFILWSAPDEAFQRFYDNEIAKDTTENKFMSNNGNETEP